MGPKTTRKTQKKKSKGINYDALSEFLERFYNLNHTEITCLLELMKQDKGMCVDELSSIVGKDKTTVSRILAELYEDGFVKREARCCTGGKKGRFYVYQAINIDDLKKKFAEDLKERTERLLKLIEAI